MKMIYDDASLQLFFDQLTPKKREKVLRASMRDGINAIRKIALRKYKAGVRVDRKAAKALRTMVYRKKLGARLTIGPKKGSRTSDSDKRDYFAMWFEGGTKGRYTKSATRNWTRRRKGHYTGRIRAVEFMRQTKAESASKMPEMVRDGIRSYISRAIERARKKGKL